MVLNVNLDISSAFDSISYKSAINSMEERNISPKIVKWYANFLHNRTAFTNHNGIESWIKVKRGTAQGGVLSSLIWNLVFESFLKIFEKGPVRPIAFADDASLSIIGFDCNTMIDVMQKSIDKAVHWGDTNELLFSPQKTTAIFFHRQKKLNYGKKLIIKGIPIDYVNQVKYLGVYLDTKLTWKYHISQKIAKAKKLIMKVKGAVGPEMVFQWHSHSKCYIWLYCLVQNLQ